MHSFFVLSLVLGVVSLFVSANPNLDTTLQFALFVGAGVFLFIGGFGLLRLKHQRDNSVPSVDDLMADLSARIAKLEEDRKKIVFSSREEEEEMDRRLSALKASYIKQATQLERKKAEALPKTSKALPIFGIVVCLLIFAANCVRSTSLSLPVPSIESSFLHRQSLDDLKGKVQRIFDQTNPNSYSFFYDDDLAVLNVWSDNTRRSVVEKAVTDDKQLEWWNDNLNELAGSCAEVQRWFDDGGHPEITVMINLVNYYNHDEIFASASRGQIIYDAVSVARNS